MSKDRTERLLKEVGQLLAEDAEYPLDGTLLYAQVDKSFVSVAIFKDLGDHVLYRDQEPIRLTYALLELWEAAEPDKRWAEIEYVIRGGTFATSFIYPEEIGPDDEGEGADYRPFARRDSIVARHFGDKPIVYPPPPSEDNLSFKL